MHAYKTMSCDKTIIFLLDVKANPVLSKEYGQSQHLYNWTDVAKLDDKQWQMLLGEVDLEWSFGDQQGIFTWMHSAGYICAEWVISLEGETSFRKIICGGALLLLWKKMLHFWYDKR